MPVIVAIMRAVMRIDGAIRCVAAIGCIVVLIGALCAANSDDSAHMSGIWAMLEDNSCLLVRKLAIFSSLR